MVKRVEIELLGEDWPGTLDERGSSVLNEAVEKDADELRIFVWSEEPSLSRAGIFLNEAVGNRTVKLTGQYSFRYDPPRSASTGAGQVPRGDLHLYSGDVEIAAWDTTGKARHGFPSGHKLPKKAYDAIVSKYPDLHGLKGRLLEDCARAIASGRQSVSVNINEAG
ncbi:hypothetical protein SAMN05216382_2644 [Sphingomonas palmae]|uniref:Uncharacterized protein n=1 Tax=Sphingomonas palmae TaxID=1855283 RepID=A0A1H7T3P1_9SPHN|nr:hypothetical protein [Sphingomonas palmae]SEL78884.1 hypothetical protein SAMN05216382_2644 [Sphingomonas palmae]